MRFEQWLAFHRKQKPLLMRDVHRYMSSRFDFSGEQIPGEMMSGSRNSIMAGLIAKLPNELQSFEELDSFTPEEIRSADLFPYKPLAHPLQTNAHMLFPESWLSLHADHRRCVVISTRCRCRRSDRFAVSIIFHRWKSILTAIPECNRR